MSSLNQANLPAGYYPCPKCGFISIQDGMTCPRCKGQGRPLGPIEEVLKGWRSCARDLSQLARAGKLDPDPGRMAEIDQIISILTRQTRNNVVLLGASRNERASLFDGLAFMIHVFVRAPALDECRILALDLTRLSAEVRDRNL